MLPRTLLTIVLTGALLTPAPAASTMPGKSGLDPARFHKVVNGAAVELFTLTNASGMEACVTNYGARLVALLVPDKSGKLRDVVLGYDNIDAYINAPFNVFGATIGRFANRIARGEFTLDGKKYTLPSLFPQAEGKERAPVLHGGTAGFHARVWQAKQTDRQTLELSLLSPDGDGGFPGTLHVRLVYKLTDDNALRLIYEATTDRPTVVNFTNHSYFNLERPGTTVRDQRLQVNAGFYTPTDANLIPTGKLAPVAGTAMDLRQLTSIGADRFDANWMLDSKGDINKEAARAESRTSGIVMRVYTTEPGMQVYTAMGPATGGKHGIDYPAQGAFCLETQHVPDSPNQPQFPTTILRPGATWHSETIYRFSVNH